MMLLFLACAVQPLKMYQCLHQQPDEFGFADVHSEPGRHLATGSFRTNLVYLNWGYSSTSKIGNSLKIAASGVTSFVSQLLTVEQAAFIFSPPNPICYDLNIPNQYLGQTYNTDLLLFVSTSNSQSITYYANAIYCLLRSTVPRRAIAGRVLWNYRIVGDQVLTPVGFQVASRVFLHELSHILVFSTGLFAHFLNSPVTSTINSVTYVVTPAVKEAAASYFGCSQGVPLENNGSASSQGQHWQKEVLWDELMVATFSQSDFLFLSDLTLALMVDSGFYSTVNRQFSESKYMTFGKNKGCAFLGLSRVCAAPQFCLQNQTDLYSSCNAFCQSTSYTTCPTQNCYFNQICRADTYTGATGVIKQTLQAGSWTSKAFQATVSVINSIIPTNFRCYPATCAPDYSKVTISIGKQNLTCSTGGAKIQVSGQGYSGVLTCPTDLFQFCSTSMVCSNHCGSSSLCIDRKCIPNSVCNQGSYPSAESGCVACHSSCTSCYNSDPCVTCPAASFRFGEVCITCDQSCASCTTVFSCLTCSAGLVQIFNGKCLKCYGAGTYNALRRLCQCSSGLYWEGKCQSECRLFGFQGMCVQNCPPGYLPDSSATCIACQNRANCTSYFRVAQLKTYWDILSIELQLNSTLQGLNQFIFNSSNFNVTLLYQQRPSARLLQFAPVSKVQVLVGNSSFFLLVRVPTFGQAVKINVALLNVKNFGPVSNSQSVGYEQLGNAPSQLYYYASCVISIVLLLVSLVFKYQGGFYNPILATQFIYLSTYFKPQLSTDYYNAAVGFQFSYFNFYPVFNLFYPDYREAVPPKFLPLSNANVVDNLLLPLAVSTLCSFLCALLSIFVVWTKLKVRRLAVFILTVCFAPVMFFGGMQISIFRQPLTNNQLIYYLSYALFGLVVLSQLVVVFFPPQEQALESEPGSPKTCCKGYKSEFLAEALRRLLLLGFCFAINFLNIPALKYGLIATQGLFVIVAFFMYPGEAVLAMSDLLLFVLLTVLSVPVTLLVPPAFSILAVVGLTIYRKCCRPDQPEQGPDQTNRIIKTDVK